MRKLFLLFIILFLLVSSGFCDSHEWKIEKSTHFIVYYIDAPPDFIKEVIKESEDCYKEITSNLGFTRYDFWLWDERAKIYIYEDAEDYQKASGQPHWSAGSALVRTKTINTYPLAAGFFDSLLPHELGHIIFREFVGLNADVPIWLDEGVACFQEKARRWGANKTVKKAIKNNTFVPLYEITRRSFTSAQDRKSIELLYAESASIVYFLIVKRGKYNFVKFCRALRDGKRLDEAISSAYPRYKNLKELNNAWIRYLKNE